MFSRTYYVYSVSERNEKEKVINNVAQFIWYAKVVIDTLQNILTFHSEEETKEFVKCKIL